MTSNRRQWRAAVGAVLAAVLAGGAPAWAQNAVGDGHKLDNNLQQGSGGYNQPVPQPDFAARNNIITGNVAGLGYFHGKINYRSPYDFQPVNDPLFRFRAESVPTLAFQGATPGGIAAAPVAPGEPAVSVLSPFAPSTVGNLQPGTGPGVRRSSDQIIVEHNATPPSTIPGYVAGQTDTLGIIAQPDGQLLAVSASPLLGLRSAPMGLSLAPVNQPGPEKTGLATAAIPGPPADLNAQARIDTRMPGTELTTEAAAAPRGSEATANEHAGSQLGMLLDNRLTPQAAGANPTALEQRVSQVQAAIFRPLGSGSYKPGEDAYLDLLYRIKMAQDRAAGRPVSPAPGVVAPLAVAVPPGPEMAPGFYAAAAAAPAPEQQAQARRQRDQAVRAYLAQAQAAAPDDATARRIAAMLKELETPNDKTAQQKQAEAQKLPASVEALIAGLQATPPVGELAGGRRTEFNQLMTEGEGHLASGHYFDALNAFRHAAVMDPQQPLTYVGLVHAEMGAGMVLSAAHDLRHLFDAHPELVAVRYQPQLLPPPQRLEWLRHQIEEMIRVSSTSEDPPLLMAYLGYQVSSPALVEYGLTLAQARVPGDPLLALLRTAWLKQYIEEAPSATQPARE